VTQNQVVSEESLTVYIDYTNWKGERSVRPIVPVRVWYGFNAYHQTPQWLLDAKDVAKNELRTFALLHIHSWTLDMNPPSFPVKRSESPAPLMLMLVQGFLVLVVVVAMGILLAKEAVYLWKIW